ncbi:MAG TPA: UDP binding domain-containing protein, partial [Hyphomicrobiales bacterium]|nr:UDP binding domain-containing protein [Hyphomicrobiales bacterium]
SLVIVPLLLERGAKVRAYDPQGRAQAEPLLPGVEWADGPLQAAKDADFAVVLTEWNEFRALDLNALRTQMKGDMLVDLRNVFRPDYAEQCGFRYSSIGRPGAINGKPA